MAISYGKQITFSAFLLQDIIDPSDELVRLAHIVDWERVHDRLRPYYSTIGRQALPIRLMVGLHLLKHKEGLSDAQVAGYQRYRLEPGKTIKSLPLAPAQKMRGPNVEKHKTG